MEKSEVCVPFSTRKVDQNVREELKDIIEFCIYCRDRDWSNVRVIIDEKFTREEVRFLENRIEFKGKILVDPSFEIHLSLRDNSQFYCSWKQKDPTNQK